MIENDYIGGRSLTIESNALGEYRFFLNLASSICMIKKAVPVSPPRIKVLLKVLLRYYFNACANKVMGCSQRLLVDISICHLQVSQSVTTRSTPLSSIWRNSGSQIACDVA